MLGTAEAGRAQRTMRRETKIREPAEAPARTVVRPCCSEYTDLNYPFVFLLSLEVVTLRKILERIISMNAMSGKHLILLEWALIFTSLRRSFTRAGHLARRVQQCANTHLSYSSPLVLRVCVYTSLQFRSASAGLSARGTTSMDCI